MSVKLPAEPESIESAKARVGEAMIRVWDSEKLAHERAGERPGLLRTHVFDFEDGIRLIISRDLLRSTGKIWLHVSGSCTPERSQREGWRYPVEQLPAIVERLDDVFDMPKETHAAPPVISPKGVVHLLFPLSEVPA